MRSFEAMSAVGIGCFVYDAALDHLVMIWRILNSGLLVCFFFLLPFAAFLKVFSPWVVILFLGSEPKAQALLPIASPLLVVVASFILLADGLRVIAGQALNGLSDMKMPALMMGLGHWGIGFPSALVRVGDGAGHPGILVGIDDGSGCCRHDISGALSVDGRISLGGRAGEWPAREQMRCWSGRM